MARSRTALAAAVAASLVACGGGGTTPSIEKPFTGWIDVADMGCGDGSPTGIGILPGRRSDAVLVYLAGGGACWGAAACDTRKVPISFTGNDFTLLQLFAAGTIFDRELLGNPFADWTWVFVPYCTGDVHAGATTADHGGQTWQHRGFANLQAAVAAATAALPRPRELVVAGSSAGGFGALVAYDLVRAEWDPAGGTTAALLDDSGPTLVGTAMPPTLLATWWDVWGLGSTIGRTCSGCETDLSTVWEVLHSNHSADRLALLSTTQDGTMRGYFADPALGSSAPVMDPLAFEASLAVLAKKLDDLGPNVASYRVGGPFAVDHALLLRAPFFASAQGSPGLDWLSAMILDPTWTSSTSL